MAAVAALLARENGGNVTTRRLCLAARDTLRSHRRIAIRNPAVLICLAATFTTTLCLGVYRELRQVVGYLFAIWLSAFLTDLFVTMRPEPSVGFPINHSKVRESLVLVAFTLAALVPLSIRFSSWWPLSGRFEKLALVMALLFFSFFIGVGCIFLLWYRYRPSQLGFNLHYWYLPLLIHAVFAGITLTVAPEKSHWRSWFGTHGVSEVLIIGVLEAALPEEFIRMLLQTRLAAIFRYQGMGFFMATFLWASLHIPIFWSENPHWALWRAICATWTIIPIGLLWGYITHRTKSLLPAILLHGFNLWGLQNL